MSNTLIIGIITGTVALLSVGLNIFWMGKTFDHLSTAINQTRDQLTASVKDLAAKMDKQFDRVDKQFERIDKRFEGIEANLKQFTN